MSTQLMESFSNPLTQTVLPPPTGTFSLTITSAPVTPFTLDGASQTTPYTATLAAGSHTIQMISTVAGGIAYRFVSWDDGNTQNPRTILLNADMFLKAIYLSDPGFVAGDSDGFTNSLTVTNGRKLLRDSFGKTFALYRNTAGNLAIAVANLSPAIRGWRVPFVSPITNGRCPAGVLQDDNTLRILYSDGGHVFDVSVGITRDLNNNVVGVTWGVPKQIDIGEQKLCVIKAHDGSLWAVWNRRDGIYPANTNSKIVAGHWTALTGWQLQDIFVDGLNTHSLYPALVERPDTFTLYVVANRSSTDNTLLFAKAVFAGTSWTWLAPNPALAVDVSVGLEDAPDMVWDPFKRRVVVVYRIAGAHRFGVHTFDATDADTRDDTPLLATPTAWQKLLVDSGGVYHIVYTDASLGGPPTHGRVLVIDRVAGGWNTTPYVIDSTFGYQAFGGFADTGFGGFLTLLNDPAPSIVRYLEVPLGVILSSP